MRAATLLLLISPLAHAELQTSSVAQPTNQIASRQAWRDPSPHTIDSVDVGDARLQYLDWGGRGPLLIFLHGWGSNAHTFDDLAPQFTDRYRVVALTQRGFGSTNPPPSGYSIARYAADVIALMRKLRHERASLVGHSFGGWVLTQLATSTPNRVERLVYLDAAFDMTRSDSVITRRPFARPSTAGIKNETEYFDWLRKYFYGMWSPALEAEARVNAQSRFNPAAQAALDEARRGPDRWKDIRAPALAVCALAEVSSEFPWISPKSAAFAAGKAYVDTVRRPFQRAECERFRKT
ncbi:MAG: alpha/beta fold hydrolase, partial [Gemmatimonadaceae bacterium]